MEIFGLVRPWLTVVVFWRPADGVTSWHYYVVPALVAIGALFGVLATDAQNTPDFWIGVSASLAAIAAATAVLIIQSFLPLSWWLRDESRPEAPPADPAA